MQPETVAVQPGSKRLERIAKSPHSLMEARAMAEGRIRNCAALDRSVQERRSIIFHEWVQWIKSRYQKKSCCPFRA